MDIRQNILNIMRRRPQAFGVPLGSGLNKIVPDDMIPLSKKTFAFLIPHENVPTLTRIFLAKMDQKGEIRNYFPLDLPGYLNLKEAMGLIVNRVNEKTLNPG